MHLGRAIAIAIGRGAVLLASEIGWIWREARSTISWREGLAGVQKRVEYPWRTRDTPARAKEAKYPARANRPLESNPPKKYPKRCCGCLPPECRPTYVAPDGEEAQRLEVSGPRRQAGRLCGLTLSLARAKLPCATASVKVSRNADKRSSILRRGRCRTLAARAGPGSIGASSAAYLRRLR